MIRRRLRCTGVPYRQGFIEVVPNIHPGHVNIEVWNLRSDVEISGSEPGDPSIPDEAYVGNTEIELSVSEAERLIDLLRDAIREAECVKG